MATPIHNKPCKYITDLSREEGDLISSGIMACHSVAIKCYSLSKPDRRHYYIAPLMYLIKFYISGML